MVVCDEFVGVDVDVCVGYCGDGENEGGVVEDVGGGDGGVVGMGRGVVGYVGFF